MIVYPRYSNMKNIRIHLNKISRFKLSSYVDIYRRISIVIIDIISSYRK